MRPPIRPFHTGRETGRPVRGRILLLSYHFPPAQTAGALRWQKLAHYVADRGYGLDVITLDPADLAIQDRASIEDLPASVRVFGVPTRVTIFDRAERVALGLGRSLRRIWPKYSTRSAASDVQVAVASAGQRSSFARSEVRFDPTSLRSWVRAYDGIATPSKEKDWALRAAALGQEIVAEGEHCAVVSCGPPHMTHEGARRLSRAVGLPLVLDFRDPWSLVERLVEHYASPLFLRFVARFEARAVEQAALIVMNTEPARRAMQEHYPHAADRIIAVLNGCDEGIVERAHSRGDPFRIAYAGSIYLDRSPANLFLALARVVLELSLTPGQIEMAFMGAGPSLESEASATGVLPYLRRLPLGTRQEAERLLASAHVLVNLYQDSFMAIPSKLFEYMRHDAALLVLAEPESATYELVRGTDALLAAPDDVEAIAAAIRRCYEEHRAGKKVTALAEQPRFSRRHQAERLLDALDAVCGEAATSGRKRS